MLALTFGGHLFGDSSSAPGTNFSQPGPKVPRPVRNPGLVAQFEWRALTLKSRALIEPRRTSLKKNNQYATKKSSRTPRDRDRDLQLPRQWVWLIHGQEDWTRPAAVPTESHIEDLGVAQCPACMYNLAATDTKQT